MTPPTTHCRSCRRPIRWCVTPAGKRIPIDIVPNTAKGNIRLTFSDNPSADPLATVLTAEAVEVARANRLPLYLTHFASCPSAGQHRKKKP